MHLLVHYIRVNIPLMHVQGPFSVEHFTMASYLSIIVPFIVNGVLGYLTMLFSESDLYFKLNGIFAKPSYLPTYPPPTRSVYDCVNYSK